MIFNWVSVDVLASDIKTHRTFAYFPAAIADSLLNTFHEVTWLGQIGEDFKYETHENWTAVARGNHMFSYFAYSFAPMFAHVSGLETIKDSGVITPATIEIVSVEADEDEDEDEAETLTCTCERCNETVDDEDVISFEESYYCEACIDRVSASCDRCSDRVSRDEIYAVPGRYDYVCQDCYDNHYFNCEGCGETYHNDSYGCDGRCDSCSENEEEDCDLVHNYAYKPTPRFFGTGKLRYGIELEVNTDSISDHAEYTLDALGEDHAYLKEDSSIGGGFEIVTHPHTFEEQKSLWQEFFKDVPAGMTSYKSGHCGMHVHVSRSALTAMQIRRMLVFVNAPENLGYISVIAQRSGNSYCKIDKKDLTGQLSSDRYEAINTTNRNTVEFRIFRGTVRKDRFFKNLDFVDAVVKYTAETNYSGLTASNFIQWVKAHRYEYKYLHNYHIEKGLVAGAYLAVEDKRQTSLPIALDEAA